MTPPLFKTHTQTPPTGPTHRPRPLLSSIHFLKVWSKVTPQFKVNYNKVSDIITCSNCTRILLLYWSKSVNPLPTVRSTERRRGERRSKRRSGKQRRRRRKRKIGGEENKDLSHTFPKYFITFTFE
ncbi:hypothetical protein NQD34_010057 [Periophthalmus magnuspinnatus]|nr:hypothetical protein NQD34_010057 [Periophthalmus magnuspinnatus]